MRQEDNRELDALFADYREATSDIEPSPEFLANVWRAIEQRRPSDWLVALGIWSPRVAAAGALAALALTLSTWSPRTAGGKATVIEHSYLEVLTSESMDEHDEALWILAGRLHR